MFAKRTDLALEARELWQESAQRTSRLSGVKATKSKLEGYGLTGWTFWTRGGRGPGQAAGSYLTIDLTTFWQRKADFFPRAVRAVGTQLRAMVPAEGPVLVVGLGNAAMTPDAVGPLTADSVLVTRHLISAMPRQFAAFGRWSVVRTGVGHHRRGVGGGRGGRGGAVRPAAIIAVDALPPAAGSGYAPRFS